MGRPRKRRFIEQLPPVEFYKPQGVPLGRLRGVILPVEGLEAMRLVDSEGLSQEEAASRMEVSTPTLSRILGEARRVVARALSEGLALRIEGGDFALRSDEEADGPREPGDLEESAGPGDAAGSGGRAGGRRSGVGCGRGRCLKGRK